MSARVKCQHCMAVKKSPYLDKDGRPAGSYLWFADCELFGNEQEVGCDCGKGHCRCYKPLTKKDEGGTNGNT